MLGPRSSEHVWYSMHARNPFPFLDPSHESIKDYHFNLGQIGSVSGNSGVQWSRHLTKNQLSIVYLT